MPPRINIPPITRGLLVALVTFSVLSAAIRWKQWSGKDSNIVVPYLNLVPSLSIIFPWTFLITTLVENNVFTLGITGATIYYGGRYLERAWSTKEFIKFLLIVTLIPNVLCFATLVVLYSLTGNISWAYATIKYAPCAPTDNCQTHACWRWCTARDIISGRILSAGPRAYCHDLQRSLLLTSPTIPRYIHTCDPLVDVHAASYVSLTLPFHLWLLRVVDVSAILQAHVSRPGNESAIQPSR